MAIGFARVEFVQRSAGKTACGKSAYNAREKIQFDGTKFAEAKAYDWSYKEKPVYNEVILPSNVDPKFKSLEILWNTVEQKENRHNSQVAIEMVVALPDDQCISLEDKIELTRTFVEEHFVKRGLAAQVNIHKPDQKILLSHDTGEIKDLDHNWHAHILVPTRRFKENGQEFDDHKARDLMPAVRGGKVISGVNWGKLWTQHQNHYFEEKGLDLRVDETGVIAQKHLGPVRLRGRAFALEEENQTLASLNRIESTDPAKILAKITETRSIFSFQDVERYMEKHLEPTIINQIRESFWTQKNIVQFLDSNTETALNKFSTTEILEEEKQILRLADGLQQNPAFKLKAKDLEVFMAELNQEQKYAFAQIIHGRKLSCIEGHAGTGKSYLLSALDKAYTQQDFKIRAFGPDNATADVLTEKGFKSSENIYRFLFSLHHGKREITKGKEVWILDETSKLGNRPLLELLKAAEKYQVQLIFAGCSSQLPSVERGGLFKMFCTRYGAQELVEIQRQKKQEQRVMTQSLAHGQMAAAIDQLVNLHGLKWHETKEEAIESLIKTWAVDQTAFVHSTSLILAHTNAEVRILNEMARLYRKEKGELNDAEYACNTAHGKIIVSVGDKIEFRKNDKVHGIVNGMRGVLIKASSDRFVVALPNQVRNITFNPEEYTGFQLGYAATYFRSQGQTVDRAYVLHSRLINKEKFYVGLTRHVHKATLFASRTEVSNIADLKRQVYRKTVKENTSDYLTHGQLEQQKKRSDRALHIERLKSSPSLIGKTKGYTLSLWDSYKNAIDRKIRYASDLRPSDEFFKPVDKEDNKKGLAVKIDDQHLDYYQRWRQDIQKNFVKILEKVEPISSCEVKRAPQKIGQNSSHNDITIPRKENFNWDNLSGKSKALLKQYFQMLNQASSLHALVKSEAGQLDLKQASHFKEWQIVCGIRNAQAFEVLKAVPHAFIKEATGKDAFDLLQERALKHEISSQKQNDWQVNLSEALKERLESLLYCLFPDGPTGRDQRGLRFGSKGSLTISSKGSQAGCFYDFEKGEGGGPLQLIQKVLNLDSSEAKEWARDFLGQSKELKVPSQFYFKQRSSQQSQEWNSLKPDTAHPAPSLRVLSSALNEKYKEVARHAYCNEVGELLFYTLRLVEKENSSKKCVLPLSYGRWQGSENSTWALKSYQNTSRTLYQLDKLNQDTSATVLIVEGEKTADAAQKLFSDKNIICVTWQGGASAVAKSDWLPLYGREVVIWPDNDQAGFKAADELCSQLRQADVKSLSVVDKDVLTKAFPEKWDLADPLPPTKGIGDINDMILMAKEKSVGIDQLELCFKGDKKELTSDKLHVQEVLRRVEERLWLSLEEKHGSRVWETKQAILNETNNLLSLQENLIKRLQTEDQLNVDLAYRIARQIILQQAKDGKIASRDQILELKQALGTSDYYHPKNLGVKNSIHGDLTAYAVDKSFSEALNMGMRAETLVKNIHTVVVENEVKLTKQAAMYQHAQAIKIQDKQNEQGQEISL